MSIGRQRFSIIPAQAVTDHRLEPRDLQVLCLLGRHTDDLGWCCRSQVKMAKELNCGRATVQRALARLVEAGYLEHRTKQRSSGADAAHDYRVVIDPPEVTASASESGDEGVPIDGQGCPPMGGQGVPTLERAPKLTTPVKRSEREAREREDSRKIEKAFDRIWREWPAMAAGSPDEARRSWLKLSPDEREAATACVARWLAAWKAEGRHYTPALSTYLGERRWTALPPETAEPPKPAYAPPFGPDWAVERIAVLLAGPTAQPATLTLFERGLVQAGKADERALLLEKTARSGFPSINWMHDQAAIRKGVTAKPERRHLATLMEAVPVGSDMFEAWRGEHDRRGWPWIPDPGDQRVVYFPAGGPDGLKGFEAAINEGKEHDGGGREAAE